MDVLTLKLQKLCNDSLTLGKLPKSMCKALIILVPSVYYENIQCPCDNKGQKLVVGLTTNEFDSVE